MTSSGIVFAAFHHSKNGFVLCGCPISITVGSHNRLYHSTVRLTMDLLNSKAAEAIAVEERPIQGLEQEEAQEISFPADPSLLSGPQLGTGTWSALEGVPDSFWDDLLNNPGDNGVTASSS